MSKNAIVNAAKVINRAEAAFRNLHGIFCVYKPPDMDLATLNQTLKHNLVTSLNKLDEKPTTSIVKVDDTNNQIVYLDKNYADTKEGLAFFLN